MESDSERAPSAGDAAFRTTRWSVVIAASREDPERSRAALATLCESYWYPLYAYVRRRGVQGADARDLVQGFFVTLLERGGLGRADPERGRFRAYLLGAIQHFLANEWRRASAEKRGGGRAPLALDFDGAEQRFALDPTDERTPERAFDRTWALVLIERVLEDLRRTYADRGRADQFASLQGAMVGDPARPYAEIALELGMTENAVKVAVHRMRARFRDRLRTEIAQTLTDPSDLERELADLFRALSA